MKNRSILLGALFLFIGMYAWAQSGSQDYKQLAFEKARNDFFNHVTVVNDDVYFFKGSWGQMDHGYWGQYLDQFKDIKFTYTEDSLDKADKLNGVNWRGKIFVTAGVGRIYYADDRDSEYSSSREGSVYQWSDWSDYTDKPIVEYRIESRNTQWVINATFYRRHSAFPYEKWDGIVLIPTDQIPNGTKNVDLVKLYTSLADSASPVKSASSSSVNNASSQTQKNSGTQSVATGLPANWKGTCTQTGYGTYPMLLRIDEQNGVNISGVICWLSTSGDTKTRFRGSVENGRIVFTEYELIQGKGAVVPTEYEAMINGSVMDGTYSTKLKSGVATGSFHLEQSVDSEPSSSANDSPSQSRFISAAENLGFTFKVNGKPVGSGK